MAVQNPFLYITPRDKDFLVGRSNFLDKVKKVVMDSLDENAIVSINGEFGIGKTLFVRKVIEDLEEKKKSVKVFHYDFNFNTLNDLRNLPSEKKAKKEIIVVIDRFELILSLSNLLQRKILKVMSDLCKAKITLLITSTDDLLKKIKNIDEGVKKYFRVLDVPPMTYEETEKLVISRLNEVRTKNKESIHPFTENEIKAMYKNAKGNPRMLLMLCASLFEEKL